MLTFGNEVGGMLSLSQRASLDLVCIFTFLVLINSIVLTQNSLTSLQPHHHHLQLDLLPPTITMGVTAIYDEETDRIRITDGDKVLRDDPSMSYYWFQLWAEKSSNQMITPKTLRNEWLSSEHPANKAILVAFRDYQEGRFSTLVSPLRYIKVFL